MTLQRPMKPGVAMHGQHLEDAIESVRGVFPGTRSSPVMDVSWCGASGNPGLESGKDCCRVSEDAPLPDCVSLVLLMAMTMEPREIRRLCVKKGLCEREEGIDTGTGLFLLHVASHIREMGVAREIGRYFRDRFPSAVSRVRKLAPEEFFALLEEVAWPAPLLWAGCTDPRQDVRRVAQDFVHRIIWRILAGLGQLRKGLTLPDYSRESAKSMDGGTSSPNSRGLNEQSFASSSQHEDLEKKLRLRDDEIKRLSLRLTEKDEEIKKLSQRLSEKERELSDLRQGQSRSVERALRRENKRLLYELEKIRSRIASIEGSVYQSSDAAQSLGRDEGEGAATRASSSVIAIHRPGEGVGDCERCTGRNDCGCPLKGLRVAVVGGLDRLEPEYRKAVSDLGAEFLFHTGRCENGTHVLKNLVCKADIVLYITSINSHGALKAVKGVCKKTGKRFYVVQNPGVSSVVNTLLAVSA